MYKVLRNMAPIKLFNLPDVAKQAIFAYLSFDEVARLRIVNRDFNEMGKEVLNRGLIKIEKFHLNCLKEVKQQLPRRESERRSHPLARHVDVLMAIETRISMLSMTYTKYIDARVACFIPGKVLDEMFRVLTIVKNSECPPRPHEILQELRDISSMAMEHFDDKIAPQLKQKMSPNSTPASLLLVKQSGSRRHSYIIRPSGSSSYARDRDAHMQQNDVENFIDFKSALKGSKSSSNVVMKEVKSLKTKIRHQGRHIIYQRNKIVENTAKIAEQSTQLAELRRLVEECSQKITHHNNIEVDANQQGPSKPKSSKKRKESGGPESGKKKKKKV